MAFLVDKIHSIGLLAARMEVGRVAKGSGWVIGVEVGVIEGLRLEQGRIKRGFCGRMLQINVILLNEWQIRIKSFRFNLSLSF
jgi:hypothetical protein